jgi:iron(III) transport system ATP-binding protein
MTICGSGSRDPLLVPDRCKAARSRNKKTSRIFGDKLMPSVSLHDVGRSYGAHKAVDGVSIHIKDGSFVTLLGPSGCGKTTTLRMIAGLEQNDAGQILIGERVVSDAARGTFLPPNRRDLGMVFQSYAIWPHMTVFQNVAYPLRSRGVPESEVKPRTMEALALVEMERFADRPAPALSGGQQQRVAIARALVSRPQVLLMDEPLSNLDVKLREQMRVELRQLQERLRITTVYVTHDQDEAMALSDDVVVMHGGKVLQTGVPQDLYRRPKNRTVASFLGSPNLVEVEVESAEQAGDSWQLRVQGSGWAGTCTAAKPREPGQRISVVLRPETLLAGPAPAECARTMQADGVVRSAIYHGSNYLVLVDVDGKTIHARVGTESQPVAGERMSLRAPASQVWALQE